MGIFDPIRKQQEQASSSDAPPQEQSTGSPVDTAIFAKVEPLIAQIRPYIQADGSDIELVRVENRVVYVRLQGACVGCPSSIYTLKMGVEARIVEMVPEVVSVEMI